MVKSRAAAKAARAPRSSSIFGAALKVAAAASPLRRDLLLEQLSALQGAPSVEMQEVPPSWTHEVDEEDSADPDVRQPGRDRTGAERHAHEAEYYDS